MPEDRRVTEEELRNHQEQLKRKRDSVVATTVGELDDKIRTLQDRNSTATAADLLERLRERLADETSRPKYSAAIDIDEVFQEMVDAGIADAVVNKPFACPFCIEDIPAPSSNVHDLMQCPKCGGDVPLPPSPD